MNVVHEEFFLSAFTCLHVFLVGTGLIGPTLLAQMEKQLELLHEEHALDIKVVGIAGSRMMAFVPDGIDISDWKNLLTQSHEEMEIGAFIKRMRELNLSNSVFVDCTASDEVAERIPIYWKAIFQLSLLIKGQIRALMRHIRL